MPEPLLATLIFSLGFLNGARTLTPVAVLCLGIHFGWFSVANTPFAFLANPISLAVFCLLAVGELIGDKLPKTPARTQAPGLIGRVVFGAACGAVLATVSGYGTGSSAMTSRWLFGGVIGGAGALLGTYLTYLLRRELTKRAGLPDLPVALVEDALTIGGSLFVASRF